MPAGVEVEEVVKEVVEVVEAEEVASLLLTEPTKK